MQKIEFDFEAKKHFIYTPNSAVPIGAPVDENGNIANDGNAIGIVLGYDNVNKKYWTKQMMVVMVGGYVDTIDAQAIWGDEYSAEAIAAMSDIIFCDDHKIGGGGGWPADLPKPSVGGYGYTDEDDTVHKIDEKYLPASGGGSAMVVNYDYATGVADKTFEEIWEAATIGVPVTANIKYGDSIIMSSRLFSIAPKSLPEPGAAYFGGSWVVDGSLVSSVYLYSGSDGDAWTMNSPN